MKQREKRIAVLGGLILVVLGTFLFPSEVSAKQPSLLEETQDENASFPNSEAAQLVLLFVQRVQQGKWLDEVWDGKEWISIEKLPSQLVTTDQGHTGNPEFLPVSLSIEEDYQVAAFMHQIQKALSSLRSPNPHHLDSSSDPEGEVDVLENSYDHEVFLKILFDLKKNDKDAYIKNMADLASCFPQNRTWAKNRFLFVFSHLFVMGKFPSLATKKTFFHFLFRRGKIT